MDGTSSVANIGAGAGAYEPAQTVVAVEPSSVMIGQRPPGAAMAVRGLGENLPLRTDGVDAALAVLTVHHWAQLEQGIAELARIARRRIVILTWDHEVMRTFWLLRDYLPAAAATDARLAVPLERLIGLLPGTVEIHAVPVPADCTDGFGAAYWRRPHAYLRPEVQAGMSMLALTPRSELEPGLRQLGADLDSGVWAERHCELLDRQEFDAGYRLVVADF
ncbi:class I SAM-dependent methyltransferase [Nocardia cyriacigeorgica]|uniref:class I SAM-dependent methyltransferase n=1 Tax=Nocardia cyriacigeorgica TaxID=135487 RepID=UPI001E5C81BA|nr:methyltransferase domain-containing protein [Nocardia cyriacigeorgica]